MSETGGFLRLVDDVAREYSLGRLNLKALQFSEA